MKILIEGYQYEEQLVAHILKGFEPFSKDGKISVEHVGYFFSKEITDCIFFLPKVLMNEKEDILGREGLKPEHIIDLEKAREDGSLTKDDYKFISNFAVWIYRAIKEYYRLNPDSSIILNRSFSLLDKSTNKRDATLLDIILSLIKFNNENQDFFMFTVKNIHSGYNKINWTKTISKSNALIQRQIPIYLNPINKKKQINFDEELLVIFFSILNFVNEEFGFVTPINFNYDLIKGEAFKNFCNGFGEIRLRQIKYKYFSDRALQLWNLCYHFFDVNQQVNSSTQDCDYLLAKNFNIVFEAIIDELLGDDKRKIPTELRDQPDGKIVDHIYKYQSLINQDDIYYIGDSKYYKIGGSLGGNSVYKQYTYAKNVIQFNINWFYGKKKEYIKYRDDLTEGYNITPNFFISAELPNDLSFSQGQLIPRNNKKDQRQMYQFKNRLFDRDTLWLSHYDVNFLYVIALYARANELEKSTFKEKSRNQFKLHILELLNKQYDFFLLVPKEHCLLQEIIDVNFRVLNGRVFCPSQDKEILILAHDKKEEGLKEIIDRIKSVFNILPGYILGLDIEEFIQSKK